MHPLIGWKQLGELVLELTSDMRLQGKFALFNAVSKTVFVIFFLLLMPFVLEKINIINTDNDLIEKREKILDLIEEYGIQQFTAGQESSFGSYNILKEEYISLEKVDLNENWNFIEVTNRLVEEELIDYRVLNYTFYVNGQMYLLEIGKSLNIIRQTERNIRWFALGLLLLFVAITMMLDISYIKFLLKPLDQIVLKKLKNVNDPGIFNFEVIHTSTDDFRIMDVTINEMMERIQTLFRKEREFTSNVSHELLTPISILQSKLENLINDSAVSEKAMVKISESLRTLSRLKSIVNSLLLIARIENEQYLKNDQVSVSELVKEAVSELKDLFEASEIEIHNRIRQELIVTEGNRALMFTMIINLLNNALKYTNKGGAVTILAERVKNKCILEIHNTGEGIDEKYLEEIFARFKKFSSDKADSHGLGLAIAKTIADFHQISLSARSKKNEGTTFELVFRA